VRTWTVRCFHYQKTFILTPSLVIKSSGDKILALDIETEILGLDYISEVMVVGIENGELGQRVATAVVLTEVSLHPIQLVSYFRVRSLNSIQNTTSLTLAHLREDLSPILPGYKLPTYLRVVKELPKNATGKVLKKELTRKIFPPEGHSEIQIWNLAGSASQNLDDGGVSI
jgi:malonyl-CoA/methylmalonyl-CoA synthetase